MDKISHSHSTEKRERLFLLDGMALAYRAYFAFISRPLINSKGVNTSAIYGFVSTLLKILEDELPDHVAVVFDTREPTFRHKMYKPYKATREKMPEDMSAQIDKLKEVILAFNVPLIEVPGYEADDIMGTLARRAERDNLDTFLVTGDKDFMQLISPRIKMYKPGKSGDEWEIINDPSGNRRYLLRLSDYTGQVKDEFTPYELRSPRQMRGRLLHLWGDLLQISSHKLLEKLTESATED